MDQYWRDQGAARIPPPWPPALDPDQMAEARNLQWHYFQLLQNEQRETRERAAAEAAARYPQNTPPPPPPMYLNHDDVAAMEPRTLNFNPYHPGQDHRTQINGSRRIGDELEAFQEKIRRERFAGLREEFLIKVAIDAGWYLGCGASSVVCVGGVAWVGGFAMRLVFSGMGWKDNSDGVWSRKRG